MRPPGAESGNVYKGFPGGIESSASRALILRAYTGPCGRRSGAGEPCKGLGAPIRALCKPFKRIGVPIRRLCQLCKGLCPLAQVICLPCRGPLNGAQRALYSVQGALYGVHRTWHAVPAAWHARQGGVHGSLASEFGSRPWRGSRVCGENAAPTNLVDADIKRMQRSEASRLL